MQRLTFGAGRGDPGAIRREPHGVHVRYMAAVLLYALIVPRVPQSAMLEVRELHKSSRDAVRSPDAGVVTPAHQIITIRMEIQAAHALHVSIKRRVELAVVQVPLLDDAVLIRRVHIIVGVGEADALDTGVMTVEGLKLIAGEIAQGITRCDEQTLPTLRDFAFIIFSHTQLDLRHSPEWIYRCQSRTS